MTAGEQITIKATVLRVDGNRVDAQTANGQLIQTDLSNVETAENKAILNSPENKSTGRTQKTK